MYYRNGKFCDRRARIEPRKMIHRLDGVTPGRFHKRGVPIASFAAPRAAAAKTAAQAYSHRGEQAVTGCQRQ